MNSASSRIILVTGASMGLGKEIARAFIKNGDTVILSARHRETLESAAVDIAVDRPGSAICHVADMSEPEQIRRLAENTFSEHGRLDVLVNNAGVYGPIGPLAENNIDEWADSIALNLTAPARLIHHTIPLMESSGGGSIINIAGGGAVKPMPTLSAYSAAKAGLVRLTESLALELAQKGIRLNAIAPGFIASRFHEPIVEGRCQVDPNIAKATRQQMERGGDDPIHASELAVFLASSAATHITGRLISAIYDDREELAKPENFKSASYFTLRRVDGVFVNEILTKGD